MFVKVKFKMVKHKLALFWGWIAADTTLKGWKLTKFLYYFKVVYILTR